MNHEPKFDNIKKFELAGSFAHYPPSLSFVIENMYLDIKPDFKTKSIHVEQRIDIVTISQISEIELDAAELDITSVYSIASSNNYNDSNHQKIPLSFRTIGDKLIIKLEKNLEEEQSIGVEIKYHAKPRKGFYFIEPDGYYPKKNLQAWTQGETTDSKYWFPCLDQPQVKFSSTVSVTVPINFVAISNGRLVRVDVSDENKVYLWTDEDRHPAYLLSVVIGEFVEIKEGYKNDSVQMLYYVPKDREQHANRSFEHTKDMMTFFEEYFDTKYPYPKYSQVTVEDFVYGGMENSSCTTLTLDTLHDKKAHLDFTSDHLVSHELAHQWFGDLVTCRDWPHLWLNEGFATYCEALYWQASRGIDEFYYYVLQTADDYLDEASSKYQRPIVTNIYKHPDDLFDRHSYEKGGIILHMLRNILGDKHFRKGIKIYLQRFANGTAETDDLRKILELESGHSLQMFFDQWVYGAGHPKLKVEFSFDSKNAIFKIEQLQDGNQFDFYLDLNVALNFGSGKIRNKTFVVHVTSKETVFQVPLDEINIDSDSKSNLATVEWFSIDPQFKILKTISIRAPKQMTLSQLRNGKTVIERIQAARALADSNTYSSSSSSSADVIDALYKAVVSDGFWAVSAEAARTLGTIKTDLAFGYLKESLGIAKHPKLRRAIVRALGQFKNKSSVDTLANVLFNDESYFVSAEAATAMGKTRDPRCISLLKKAFEIESFQNVVSQGAISGLKEFNDSKEVLSLLIEKTAYGQPYRIRESAVFALGKFARDNKSAFDTLKSLLNDSWFRVRINACKAFADSEDPKAMPDIAWVAEHDLDHRVRRIADECINIIKDSIKTSTEVVQIREEIENLKSKSLGIMLKMDQLERSRII